MPCPSDIAIMHSFAEPNSPPLSELVFCSYDKVYHKLEERSFGLTRSDCHLTIITLINWIYIGPLTVINHHD